MWVISIRMLATVVTIDRFCCCCCSPHNIECDKTAAPDMQLYTRANWNQIAPTANTPTCMRYHNSKTKLLGRFPLSPQKSFKIVTVLLFRNQIDIHQWLQEFVINLKTKKSESADEWGGDKLVQDVGPWSWASERTTCHKTSCNKPAWCQSDFTAENSIEFVTAIQRDMFSCSLNCTGADIWLAYRQWDWTC